MAAESTPIEKRHSVTKIHSSQLLGIQSMVTLASIHKQIADLEKQAAAIQKAETAAAAVQAKELIARYNLTADDLGLVGKPGKPVAAKKAATTKVRTVGVAKYRDQKSGKTWTGHGKAPGWIASKRNRDALLISVLDAPAVAETAPVAAPVKKAAIKKAAAKKTAVAPPAVTPVADTVKDAVPKKATAPVAPAKKAVPRKSPAKKAAAAAAAASEAISSEATTAPPPTESPAA